MICCDNTKNDDNDCSFESATNEDVDEAASSTDVKYLKILLRQKDRMIDSLEDKILILKNQVSLLEKMSIINNMATPTSSNENLKLNKKEICSKQTLPDAEKTKLNIIKSPVRQNNLQDKKQLQQKTIINKPEISTQTKIDLIKTTKKPKTIKYGTGIACPTLGAFMPLSHVHVSKIGLEFSDEDVIKYIKSKINIEVKCEELQVKSKTLSSGEAYKIKESSEVFVIREAIGEITRIGKTLEQHMEQNTKQEVREACGRLSRQVEIINRRIVQNWLEEHRYERVEKMLIDADTQTENKVEPENRKIRIEKMGGIHREPTDPKLERGIQKIHAERYPELISDSKFDIVERRIYTRTGNTEKETRKRIIKASITGTENDL
ncbi:unnamed protein product [Brassicogethes aeneus]|uniref:Uncharacterized protein n=1 Tax=Brassicogethes aeneus TaxID=1431903 RepID=A0A9P0BA18_BRAAE|nr:unnamed protein product [Brassicogethes aeneus]